MKAKMPDIIDQTGRFVKSNAPEILTAVGVSGVVSTAYLTHQAALKARDTLKTAPKDLSRKEKLKLVWKHYIPPAISGVATISCIVGSSKASAKRTAAAVAAYTAADRALTEYKEQIVKQIGPGKEQKARDAIAQEKVAAAPLPSNGNVVVLGGGHILCFEEHTGRYFRSSMQALLTAQNEINFLINNSGQASLAEFYDQLGLERTSISSHQGWDSDRLLHLEITTVTGPGDEPCFAFKYNYGPKPLKG